jgi:cob(I)alamin adenosyltransferase
MVRLDRIYTRGGDKGMTSLGDGARVSKTHPRIAAYGCVDELNAVLGVVVRQPGLAAAERRLLRRIQNDLFDVGADLCVPRPADEPEGARLRIAAAQATALEKAIDAYTEKLEPLRSFVLPGGTAASAWLHVGRVVCRRAELAVAALAAGESQTVGAGPLVYLNRLSDLLFVMARWANARGRGDVLWQPGGGRAADSTSRGSAGRRSRGTPSRTRRSR